MNTHRDPELWIKVSLSRHRPRGLNNGDNNKGTRYRLTQARACRIRQLQRNNAANNNNNNNNNNIALPYPALLAHVRCRSTHHTLSTLSYGSPAL